MAKEVAAQIRLRIKAKSATPAPPVGPTLGGKGVNIKDFCDKFNSATQNKGGQLVPVRVKVYGDKSFDFVMTKPPAVTQLLEAVSIQKGSPESNRKKIASISWDRIKEIAEDKMEDMNAFSLSSAMKMIAGTARSMGISVTGEFSDTK
ncbi:MAG: 50S ribosomal protein L11 [Solitalea-like symbiont of Tyrophagus putrescentiae]